MGDDDVETLQPSRELRGWDAGLATVKRPMRYQQATAEGGIGTSVSVATAKLVAPCALTMSG